jgi:hypothetical protein
VGRAVKLLLDPQPDDTRCQDVSGAEDDLDIVTIGVNLEKVHIRMFGDVYIVVRKN